MIFNKDFGRILGVLGPHNLKLEFCQKMFEILFLVPISCFEQNPPLYCSLISKFIIGLATLLKRHVPAFKQKQISEEGNGNPLGKNS